MIISAFTCTGSYAILIMLGIKRVENRSTLPSPKFGRCAITCSKSFCKEEYGEFVKWASKNLKPDDFDLIPAWADVKDWPGKIIGACDYEVDDCRESEWDEGYDYWWKLSKVVCFDVPIPCRGNVGMWEMPAALSKQVSVADILAQAEGMKIASTDDAERLFRAAVSIAGKNEGFFVLPLDATRHVLTAPILVSIGESTTTDIEPREVFGEAMKVGAASIIVAHNHPSGNVTPSVNDLKVTKTLKEIASSLGIEFIDHLIFGSNDV